MSLYPVTLLNLIMGYGICFVDFLGFSTYVIIVNKYRVFVLVFVLTYYISNFNVENKW